MMVIWSVLGVIVGFFVSFMWSLILSIPLLLVSWWIVYRSGWIE